MAYTTPTFIRKSLLAVSAFALTAVTVPAAFAATSAAPAAKPSAHVKVAQNSSPWRGSSSRSQSRSENRGTSSNTRSSTRSSNRDSSTRSRNVRTNTQGNRNRSQSGDRSRTVVNNNRTVVRVNNNNRNNVRRNTVRSRPAVHYANNNRGYRSSYRSGLGISFNFGTPGYSRFRWAPSPYSFYRASYGGYGAYQARTVCNRVTLEAWRYGRSELVSVVQCSNPWDGTYIVQGSEQLIASRW